ncbi:hypothetical protein [Gemmatimonas sp.]|uniref:hypothetical protein n=1 Tax=Gemmatimonas sp. TaxID=1962908 RepID=UPI0025BF5034|nr:hypothetical protein [Gemmatimonas sp.]MCA2991523.1 hypothetical protein [Gemmatimonas sp.]
MGRPETRSLWTYSYGTWGNRVFATERSMSDRTIKVRYKDRATGEVRFVSLAPEVTVRDTKGKLAKDFISAAELQVERVYEAVRDRIPFEAKPGLLIRPQRVVRSAGPASAVDDASASSVPSQAAAAPAPMVEVGPEERRRSVTLAQAVKLIADPVMGLWPLKPGEPSNERRNESVNHLKRAVAVLGPTRRVADLETRDFNRMWVTLAEQFAREGQCGYRMTQRITQTLIVGLRYLRQEQEIPANAGHAPEKWKEAMDRKWVSTRGALPTVTVERFTREEAASILGALDDPRVDPRLRLAVELGAELRGAQLLRTMRSAVKLNATEFAPHGTVTVTGAKRKPGTTIVLTARQRLVLDQTLTTTLGKYEAEFLARRTKDYPLFPSKVLRDDGVANLHADVKPMTTSGLDKLFKRLVTEIAGVDMRPNCGWYGLRRIFVDVTNAQTGSRQAKNVVSSHSLASVTRDATYASNVDPALLKESADIRRRAREELDEIAKLKAAKKADGPE